MTAAPREAPLRSPCPVRSAPARPTTTQRRAEQWLAVHARGWRGSCGVPPTRGANHRRRRVSTRPRPDPKARKSDEAGDQVIALTGGSDGNAQRSGRRRAPRRGRAGRPDDGLPLPEPCPADLPRPTIAEARYRSRGRVERGLRPWQPSKPLRPPPLAAHPPDGAPNPSSIPAHGRRQSRRSRKW